MQVILHENIPNLGSAGDIVVVRDGFARNFLLPRKKAVLADPSNIEMFEHQKKVVAAKISKVRGEAEAMAKKLQGVAITIARESGEDDKIFGSVTSKDIVDALRNEGYTFDRHDVQIAAPFKQIGVFDVSIKLHRDVMATVKLWVVKK